MGMDIPVAKTNAIVKAREINKPGDGEETKIEQDDIFYIKLAAAVDKIKAYKNYFYNNGTRKNSTKVSKSQDASQRRPQKPAVQYPFLKLVPNAQSERPHFSSKNLPIEFKEVPKLEINSGEI